MAASELRISVSAPDEVRDQNCPGEGDPAYGRRRQNAAQCWPAAHHHYQVCRDDQRNRSANAADPGAQAVEWKAGDARESHDGRGNRAECHWSRIRQQADAGGIERRESQAGKHGRRYGHGSSEARRAFNKCAEREGDQQCLEPPVNLPTES